MQDFYEDTCNDCNDRDICYCVGPRGLRGFRGPTGADGLPGFNGATGPTGANGVTGMAGATGSRGPIGLPGSTGMIGVTGPTGPTGAKGDTGAAGPIGEMPLITVSGTITGDPGTSAAVDETFTPSGAQLVFTIPAGPTGATGPAGANGLAGSPGATGVTGVTGRDGADGLTGPTGPIGKVVLAYGSLRGANNETPGTAFTPVTFSNVGPLSDTVKVSSSGNALIVEESGLYQITISINAEATTDPDANQPYLNAIITVNGNPLFTDTTTFFKIFNRSSSSFIVQSALAAGDEVGVSIQTNYPMILGYMNRSLTLVQLSD